MKGKKLDRQFVSAFITECIQIGLDSQDQIIERAKIMVSLIEDEIKKVENQKTVRSKLLDVITMFEKPVKADRTIEIKILSFFKIQNPHICKYICEKVRSRLVKIDDLKHKQFSSEDIVFCIKQLVEHRILIKIEDQIARGDMFDDYMKFVLRKTQ